LVETIQLYPKLGEAYRLKVLFNDLWEMPDKPAAWVFLTQGLCGKMKFDYPLYFT
jgi:hypothetical protein